MEENLTNYSVWLAFGVLAVSLLFLLAGFILGKRLHDRALEARITELVKDVIDYEGLNKPSNFTVSNVRESYREYLYRRNEYYEVFGQISVALLIVASLTLLLIVDAVEPDGALPIIGAIAGFVVGKSSKFLPTLPNGSGFSSNRRFGPLKSDGDPSPLNPSTSGAEPEKDA